MKGRPIPFAPSTAQIRFGHCRATRSSWRWLRASVRNNVLRAVAWRGGGAAAELVPP